MNKQKIRIAQLKLYVVRKKCRKEEFEILQGIGENDEEAISVLKENFEKQKENWKTYRITKSFVYDALRVIYDSYSTIQQPLMPNASDNLKEFELIA